MKKDFTSLAKWMLGDRLYIWVESNFLALCYIAFLMTFLVMNTQSGIYKCEQLQKLEQEQVALKWEYLQKKAEYAKFQSRMEVMPEDVADHASVPYRLKMKEK
jgi:hypothetical protein